MPDQDGYPTEKEVETIKEWDLQKHPAKALLEHIRSCWWHDDWGFSLFVSEEALTLELHTGGWSGNEEIISTLQQTLFWFMYWEASWRGGHYLFKIPKTKKEPPCEP